MENNTTNFATQNSAPAPVQSAASAPVSNKQGGTKKTPTILMIAFLITTLGFAGAFAWAMLNGSNSSISTDKSDAKCIVTQEQIDNPEEGTVAEVVADFDADSYVRGLIRKVDKKVREYNHDHDCGSSAGRSMPETPVRREQVKSGHCTEDQYGYHQPHSGRTS